MERILRSLALPTLALTLLYALSGVPAHAMSSVEVEKLLAADAGEADLFGYSVALDGDTALIGAYLVDANDADSGAAYVFTRTNGTWTQQQKLVAADGAADDQFGFSVALDGDTVVIGAWRVYDNSPGSAYVFTRSNGIWTQQQKLLPADDSGSFGFSVALDGDTALVGAYHDNQVSWNAGAVYVFTRADGTWSQQHKLLAADGETQDNFGNSVALDGDTALIGAHFDNDIVRGSGAAYVFTRTDDIWSEQQKLQASDGSLNQVFGGSVALDSDTALIGAIGDNELGPRTGAAYVFTRSGNVWSEQQKLLHVNAEIDDSFGISVALSGDTALIGADGIPLTGQPGVDDKGFAYAFTRSGDVWTRQQKLLASDRAYADFFGNSVALDGDTALIGAFGNDDNGTASGSAYVFDLTADSGVDEDEDGVVDVGDNCPADFNPLQENFDNDLNGDACDTDDDNDSILDDEDNCPLTVNANQANFDNDGAGDVCDEDDDNDGVPDNQDVDPFDPNVGEGIEVTVSRSVLSTADDVEQRAGGRIAFDSNDLELVDDSGFNQSVGLRFDELAIPQGAIILDARLLFWVDEQNDEPTSLILRGVDSDDATQWRSSLHDVSARPRTSASINWSPAPWTERGAASVDLTQSPDLSTVVQEIINRPGWQADNALSLVIEGSGRRVAYAYDQLSGPKAPMLNVRYATVDGNAAPSVELGTHLEVLQSDALTLKGLIQDDGLPASPGTTSLEWRKLSGPGTVDFDDPKSASTAVTFSSTGRYELELRAFDGALIGLDRIIITVTGEIGEQIVERRIAGSNDDAEEALTSAGEPGPIDLDSSDLELVVESTPQLVGLRFADLAIPTGANITQAWVQFTVDETRSSAAIDLNLSGESVADAAGFESSVGNLSSRLRTAASVSWSPPAWARIDDVGEAQRTPDLSAIVQEIVDGDGWQSGNALVVLIDGSGQRIAESFDGERNSAPLLHVEYQ